MPGQRLDPRKKRVFDSVFGALVFSQPTPVATPATGFTASGQAFGVLPTAGNSYQQDALTPRLGQDTPSKESDHARDQVRWDRSWHNVTHSLNLPKVPDNVDPIVLLNPALKPPDATFKESLQDLLFYQRRLPYASHTEDIITWHTTQVRLHFLHQILPVLLRFSDDLGFEGLLFRSVRVLEASHRLYLYGLSMIVEELELAKANSSLPVVQNFRQALRAVVSNSVTGKLAGALKAVLRHYVSAILGLPSSPVSEAFPLLPEDSSTEKALGECLGLVESLKNLGLAGESFQITFAEVMHDAMSEYVYLGCKGLWSSQDVDGVVNLPDQRSQYAEKSNLPRTAHHNSTSRCVTDLCNWIQDRYAKLAIQVIDVIDDAKSNPVKVTLNQVEKWKEMGIGHLASLRTDEMFDIVGKWPQCSGALDDLRTAITTPQRRLHLTDVFASTLNEKLLHPGASTLQILQTYISMIRSFHDLDQSKVLLDRVAYPLQVYLCSREDTVRIIITGLLSDIEDAQGNPVVPGGDKLVELALALNNGQEQFGQRANDEDLDWHDMDWLPDPVDAGPGYKRSKSADIIGTLIGVLGSQDVFIKEFQNIIGENLLKHDGGFEKEVSILTSTRSTLLRSE
jgi:anaphase-promoting complex subunit 2